MTSKILVTGVSGFVGSAISAALQRRGSSVVGAVRRAPADGQVAVGDIGRDTDWRGALQGVGCVVHSAGRAHIVNDTAADPLAEFRAVNVQGTLHLAAQAAESGVKRFVFLSSVKVNGEASLPGAPFTAEQKPAPLDPYGLSKQEAEEGLRELAANTGMELVIIRPVLVYGPGVKANFHSMMRWLTKGVPLPLGAINNQRSLVALDNLVDLIVTCIDHPAAANQTFLASDGEDVSTSELLRRMAKALGRPARLLPVPGWLLQTAARLLGKGDVAQRLCGSLQVDISKTRNLLGWTPPVTFDEALQLTANDFLEHQNP